MQHGYTRFGPVPYTLDMCGPPHGADEFADQLMDQIKLARST